MLSNYALSGSLTVDNLRCEFRDNPVAIDVKHPRLNWHVNSSVQGAVQTAYQVLVATRPELLTPDSADLWNSNRQDSSETLQIQYDGKPLRSNQTVYWIVRSWDQSNEPSHWSAPGQWTTALLEPGEWQASWIGTEKDAREATKPIEQAKWIWSDESQDNKSTDTENGVPAPGAVRYLRAVFNLPTDAFVEKATFDVCVDNFGKFYLNGELLGSHDEWEVLKSFSADKLIPGQENVLAARVENGGDKPNLAALAAVLQVPLKSGKVFLLPTNNETWESSLAFGGKGWPDDIATDDTKPDWKPAHKVRDWGAGPWKTAGTGTTATLPLFRKEIILDKPVKSALVHICGLGHHLLKVNGTRIGDHFLDPAWSKYEKTVFYNTFDITSNLTTGTNAFGVMLGKGFYNTAGDRRIFGVHTDRPLALIAQAHIEFTDGSTTTIKTDNTWKWTTSPLVHNSILGGSDYDARLYPDGWDMPRYDDSKWETVHLGSAPGGKLTAASAPPMRTFEAFKPVSVVEPEPAHFVYDFGQNASAAVRIKVKGPAGSSIQLRWSEQRHGQDPHTNNGKGLVDQSGIGHGHLTYTLRGDEAGEDWFTEMFYTGFQYMQLTGGVPAGHSNPENKPQLLDITSVHVRTDQPVAGTFHCSNDMLNRIDKMIDWAVRSNQGHVFTDCPQREKLGYLEVPWLMWASEAMRYDIAAWMEKITLDIRDSQQPDGKIFTVAPSFPVWEGGFQYTPEWGSAGVFLPWYLYEWYGSRHALEVNYDMMKAFVDYMSSTAKDFIPPAGLGDWYDYGHGQQLGGSRFTPPELTATAVFAACADTVSSAAVVLGNKKDATAYAKLASDIRRAFNREFRTGPGQYKNNGSPQTAHAMALVFNMVPQDERTSAARAIVDDLEKRGWQQTSGDVGYRFLINALADSGNSESIFKILDRDELGSYAHLVKAGWTSLPEAWNADHKSSFNHCMLGHIQEWFSQHLVGIAPAPGSHAFDRILIQPTPGETVSAACGTFDSPRGKISVNWKLEGDRLVCDFSIPANTTALVRLPVPAGARITESGEAIDPAGPIKQLPRAGKRELFDVPSGQYSFAATF